MSNLIDNLKLQVQTAKPDIFVLSLSQLNAYKLGGAAEAENYEPNTEWLDIIGDTTSISIQRGAKRGDSIDTEVEVGTLEARVYDGNLDPNSNPYIKMGVPIRLQSLVLGSWVTQYTGTISRVVVSYDADKKSTVTLYAVDRVKDLANINRAGVVAGTFAQRVDDLLSKHGIDFTVTGGTSSLADNNYESTLVNHLTLAQNTELGSIFVDKDNVVKAYGNGALPTSFPELFFTDTKQTADSNLLPANTARGGDVNQTAEGFIDSWGGNRAYSTTRQWEGAGSFRFQRTSYGIASGSHGFACKKFPVTPGKTYTGSVWMFTASTIYPAYSQQVHLEFHDAAGNYITEANNSYTLSTEVWQRGYATKVAPANAATARINVTSNTVITSDVYTYYDGWQLEEGSLKDFNYPDKAYYLVDGFTVGYDDSIMFNDIFVRNLTRGVDEEMNYTSIETVYGPFTNKTSVATWGSRQTELTTNFATEADVTEYAGVVLDAFDKPELRVDSIRWNATDHIGQVSGLELFDLINIEYSSEAVTINKPFRVLAIEHDITPDGWLVTLDLLDVN